MIEMGTSDHLPTVLKLKETWERNEVKEEEEDLEDRLRWDDEKVYQYKEILENQEIDSELNTENMNTWLTNKIQEAASELGMTTKKKRWIAK